MDTHTHAHSHLKSERLIVIDDNRSTLDAFVKAAQAWRLGLEIVVFDQGEEAIDFVRAAQSGGIVLVDSLTPSLPGPRVAQEILAIDPESAIVVFSGASDREVKKLWQSVPWSGHLKKPIQASRYKLLIQFEHQKLRARRIIHGLSDLYHEAEAVFQPAVDAEVGDLGRKLLRELELFRHSIAERFEIREDPARALEDQLDVKYSELRSLFGKQERATSARMAELRQEIELIEKKQAQAAVARAEASLRLARAEAEAMLAKADHLLAS